MRQVLEMVAGVRFELTTFGLWVEGQTLSPDDSIALIAIWPSKRCKKAKFWTPVGPWNKSW
jgi:hypothetical protein